MKGRNIVSQWQPDDPYKRPQAQPPAVPPEFQARTHVQPHAQSQYPATNTPQRQERQPARVIRTEVLTAAGQFWYYLGCVPMAAMYFCKVPCKKALADAGMAEMTAAEKFWYVLMCIPFGLGYFCKLPVSKALSEAPQFRRG